MNTIEKYNDLLNKKCVAQRELFDHAVDTLTVALKNIGYPFEITGCPDGDETLWIHVYNVPRAEQDPVSYKIEITALERLGSQALVLVSPVDPEATAKYYPQYAKS